MRMVPSNIVSKTGSDAERRLFKQLATLELGRDAIGYHSVNLSRHEYKRVGELDFVITTKSFVLVLEVKGGRISCHEGLWTYIDRYDEEFRTRRSPFEQARSGMFSLEQRLSDDLGKRTAKEIVFGYAVAFPDASFDVRSVEWDDDLVIDADRLVAPGGLQAAFERLMTHWKAVSPGRSGLDGPQYADVGRMLRPDFEKVASLRARTDSIDAAMEELTEEQFVALDYVDEWPRLIFAGGAGTGKTFIAAEAARRHAAEGARVLYLCPGARLAEFIRPRLDVPGIEIASLENLAPGRRDVLIVDEAQDMMSFSDIELLDELVEGGIESGDWRLFLDPNRQHSVVGTFDPEAFELVKSYGAHTVPLRRNCRNTPQIVEQTQVYTGGDLGAPIAGDGPKVEFVDVDEGGETEGLEGLLERLFSEDVAPGQITVLSAVLSPEDSCIRGTRQWARRKVEVVDAPLCATWPPSGLTWSTIDDFKGLENRFIVLADLDHLALGERGTNQLYIAMSRARASLVVLTSPAVREHLSEMAHAVLVAQA